VPWILNLPSFSSSFAMAAEDKNLVLLRLDVLLVRGILEVAADCNEAAALLEEDMNIRCIISLCGSVTYFVGEDKGKIPNRIPL